VPSTDWNLAIWGRDYAWPDAGDEWSAVWGGAKSHWFATLLPRIWPYLPTGTLLEIAPGFGRWTQFLLPACDRLIGVDIAPACVEACRRRFPDAHAEFHANDGRSLSMVADGTVDFAFSFDSLVHCERDVMNDYLRELARVLTPEGIAFLHHSNVGESIGPDGTLQPPGRRNEHSRAESVSAALVDELARDAGLACVAQELVDWGADFLNDAFSTIARPGSRWAGPPRVRRNPTLMAEARSALDRAEHYGPVFIRAHASPEPAPPRRTPTLVDQPIALPPFVAVGLGDELLGNGAAVAACADALAGAGESMLVVFAPGLPDWALSVHAGELAAAVGQSAPEVVVVTSPAAGPELAALATCLVAVGPPPADLAALPRVHDAAGLRAVRQASISAASTAPTHSRSASTS
jgi:SAM-dependent methyltransferase